MLRRLILAVALLAPISAHAQFATIGPTQPTADNGDRLATTAWVNNFFATGLPLSNGKIFIGNVSNQAAQQTVSGDLTLSNGGVGTLATVNANVGSFGSATSCVTFTTNGKGLITAASAATCTPALASVTGLGTGVSTFLATPTSANLAGAVTDETGTGALVFANGPTLIAPALGTPASGNGSNLTALNATQLTTGTIPAARTNGHQNGTTTNDNAAAGEVGEFVSSTVLLGSAVSLTTSTAANVTSISLTPGDWDVWGSCATSAGGTTVTTQVTCWTSTTTAAVPTAPNNGGEFSLVSSFANGASQIIPAGRQRISLSTTTTVFLSALAVFTTSTESVYGFIGARRMR